MKRYKVTLSAQERADLPGIAGKGTHAASTVINALILLNCDHSGERTERPRTSASVFATILCVGTRRVDWIKKKFVLEGLGLTLDRQLGKYAHNMLIDGRLEALLFALSWHIDHTDVPAIIFAAPSNHELLEFRLARRLGAGH